MVFNSFENWLDFLYSDSDPKLIKSFYISVTLKTRIGILALIRKSLNTNLYLTRRFFGQPSFFQLREARLIPGFHLAQNSISLMITYCVFAKCRRHLVKRSELQTRCYLKFRFNNYSA